MKAGTYLSDSQTFFSKHGVRNVPTRCGIPPRGWWDHQLLNWMSGSDLCTRPPPAELGWESDRQRPGFVLSLIPCDHGQCFLSESQCS